MAPRFIHLSVLGGKQKQKHVKLILQEKKKKRREKKLGTGYPHRDVSGVKKVMRMKTLNWKVYVYFFVCLLCQSPDSTSLVLEVVLQDSQFAYNAQGSMQYMPSLKYMFKKKKKKCLIQRFSQAPVGSRVPLVLSLLPSSGSSGLILSVGSSCEGGKRNLPETPICTDPIMI